MFKIILFILKRKYSNMLYTFIQIDYSRIVYFTKDHLGIVVNIISITQLFKMLS